MTRRPIHGPEFQDAAVWDDDHLVVFSSQQLHCGSRSGLIAGQAQSVKCFVGATIADLDFLPLKGVLHVNSAEQLQLTQQLGGKRFWGRGRQVV